MQLFVSPQLSFFFGRFSFREWMREWESEMCRYELESEAIISIKCLGNVWVWAGKSKTMKKNDDFTEKCCHSWKEKKNERVVFPYIFEQNLG